MIKKMRDIHLIESYGGQGRKYLRVSRLKYLYLVVQKYGTKYQKKWLNTNLIRFFIDQQLKKLEGKSTWKYLYFTNITIESVFKVTFFIVSFIIITFTFFVFIFSFYHLRSKFKKFDLAKT